MTSATMGEAMGMIRRFGKIVFDSPSSQTQISIDNGLVTQQDLRLNELEPYSATFQESVLSGWTAVRFNFRGVGKSQGVHGAGFTESEDLLAVIGWLRQRWPGRPLWLAGFSFGSWVALRGAAAQAAAGDPAVHLLLVAPPVHHNDFETIEHTGCPVTVLVGEQDEVVPVAEMLAWAKDSVLNPDLVRFPVSGHFFHGQLVELVEVARQTFP